ncbi:MAG: hypothetical protein WD045_01450 [Pirellulaceae bacterium]
MSPGTRYSNSVSTDQTTGPVLVEQAIFTSARTSRLDGYQLVAVSPGVTDDDARELATWGPAHDSLIQDETHETSTNFHPLGPHKYCVARTMLGGAEYSGRRGRQVYTHSLIIKKRDFVRFHNNPFELLIAALAREDVRPQNSHPNDLPVLRLLPSGDPVNSRMIAEHRDDTTLRKLVAWFQEALVHDRLILSGYENDDEFARFFNLLPVAARPWFSFSTRLKFSTGRKFRMIGLAGDVEEQRRAVRLEGIPHLNLNDPPNCNDTRRHPWSGLVQAALRVSSVDMVAELISQLPLDLTEPDLVETGRRLRIQLVRHLPEKQEPSAPKGIAPKQAKEELHSAEPDLPELLAKIDAALAGNVEELASLQQDWKSLWAKSQRPVLTNIQAACQEHTTWRWQEMRQQETSNRCDEALDILCLIFGISRTR